MSASRVFEGVPGRVVLQVGDHGRWRVLVTTSTPSPGTVVPGPVERSAGEQRAATRQEQAVRHSRLGLVRHRSGWRQRVRPRGSWLRKLRSSAGIDNPVAEHHGGARRTLYVIATVTARSPSPTSRDLQSPVQIRTTSWPGDPRWWPGDGDQGETSSFLVDMLALFWDERRRLVDAK